MVAKSWQVWPVWQPPRQAQGIHSPFTPAPFLTVLVRTGAALFLAAIALSPVAIVLAWPGKGGIWVAGYVVGIATVPLVAFAVLRSVNALAGEERLLPAFVSYSAMVMILSIASAVWALS